MLPVGFPPVSVSFVLSVSVSGVSGSSSRCQQFDGGDGYSSSFVRLNFPKIFLREATATLGLPEFIC